MIICIDVIFLLPPSPPVPLFYLLPSMPQLCPIFVRKACTHSSLLRFCPDVFFFFFCKTKTCNIITKLLSFSLPKSELLKTLKSNKKKKSEMLRSLLVHVKSLYLKGKKQKQEVHYSISVMAK